MTDRNDPLVVTRRLSDWEPQEADRLRIKVLEAQENLKHAHEHESAERWALRAKELIAAYDALLAVERRTQAKEILSRLDEFPACEPCITVTHCEKHRRCLAECEPADLVVERREPTHELREQLAALAHEQWAGWMRYLFERSVTAGNGGRLILEREVVRWTRQMATDYADLPEAEKDSDRKEADRMLALIAAVRVERRETDATKEP